MRALYEAVDAADLERLIEASGDVNARDHDGRTLMQEALKFPGIHMAAAHVVKALLNGGIDPDAADRQGETALHTAAFYGQTQGVRLLLDAGADVNARNRQGETPLFRAGWRNDEVLTLLLEAGADDLATSMSGRTPMDVALDRGELGENMVRVLQGQSLKRSIEAERLVLRETMASMVRESPNLQPAVAVKRKRL